MALVLVDAENVRRSVWPNLTPDELVTRARDWAGREGHALVVVFDGPPPEEAADLAGRAPADDELVALAAQAEGPVWAVTSDRELRRRLEDRVERFLGGGSFAREL
jgi:hypothetical protein